MAKKKDKEPKQPNTGGGKRGALRAAARARRKARYAGQFFTTEKNQRRRLTRHVRSHPQDQQALRLHAKRVGGTDSLQFTRKGRKQIFIAERGIDAWRARRGAHNSGAVAA